MQPGQQRALELILAGHSVTDIASQVGVRRETVWRWRNDPSFASEVSVRQGQRRQSIHDELDAGVIESVRMLRGLVADTDAPPGARVRAATALMDRAGLTPAYAVEVRHSAEDAQQQATDPDNHAHVESATWSADVRRFVRAGRNSQNSCKRR